MTAQATLGSGFIDPVALMRIKSLQVRARVVVEGFYKGLHRSPFHGFSAEFSEYRQYTPGDDPRYLDWRLYARSDRYYIKRFEDETNLRCYLVTDASRSMAYAAGPVSKFEYARTVAATIAYFLSRQRDAVGLMTFEDKVVDYLPPRHRPGHLHRMMAMLQREPTGRATDIVGPLSEVAGTIKKRGLFVLITDLLAPVETLTAALADLRAVRHEVLVLRVLDPAELNFPFDTAAMFQDMESGREIFIDPDAAAPEYQRRFAEHAKALETACLDLAVDLETITTDQPLERVLFDLLKARMRRGRSPLRQTASAAGGAR